VSDLVITEDREAVRHVVLNRPEKRNAFNQDLVLAVGAALRAAADDPSVRCVVLRGNGPVFSAGMDVAALAGAASQPERLRSFRRACLEAWNLCEEMTKPVVAQIHGVCLGGAVLLYPLVSLGPTALLFAVWVVVRGALLVAVVRQSASDRAIRSLTAGWALVSVLVPTMLLAEWSDATIVYILGVLIAYSFIWGSLELTVGLHLRARARELRTFS